VQEFLIKVVALLEKDTEAALLISGLFGG